MKSSFRHYFGLRPPAIAWSESDWRAGIADFGLKKSSNFSLLKLPE